jgi:NAD-dependent SIR2 family protein deacetylase
MDKQARNKGLEINKSVRFLAGQLRLKNQKVIFFISAGVSSASGLPLGNALRDVVLRNLYQEYPSFDHVNKFRASFYPDQKNILLEMVLQQVGQRLGHDGINDFLKPFFNKVKEPSLSHELLASLVEKRFISLILTTNFDNLIEEALKREKVDFRVLSERAECVSIDKELNKDVIIWKLHGTIEDPRSLAATEQDVLHFPQKTQDALRFLLQNYNIVFVGYSMNDLDFMEIINQIDPHNKKYSFFWVGPSPLDKTRENIRDTVNKFDLSENYIQMLSDDFFNELNYLLHLRAPTIIWNADEAILLRGGVRGEGDPWNRDCPSYTRIFGATSNQGNYREWDGATLQLHANLQETLKIKKNLLKGASLRIEIPPIDGKGIHGKEGGKVSLFLYNDKGRFKLSELICKQYGYLETWWPHDDRYRGIYPEFTIDSDSIKHFDGLQTLTLELEIEGQVCMDVSRFLLYFF